MRLWSRGALQLEHVTVALTAKAVIVRRWDGHCRSSWIAKSPAAIARTQPADEGAPCAKRVGHVGLQVHLPLMTDVLLGDAQAQHATASCRTGR